MTPLWARLLLAMLCGSALGCGGGRGPAYAVQPGLRVFDVVAVLTPANGQPAFDLPDTNKFTLVLDAQNQQMIVGGAGSGSQVPVTTPNGRTFRTSHKVVIGSPGLGRCATVLGVTYDALEFTISGDTLEGHVKGSADISCGDCILQVVFNAALSGVADVKAPFVLAGQGPAIATPFTPFTVLASEPLLATSKARLQAGDGSSVELVPMVTAAEPPFVMGFSKPEVVLHPGVGYSVTVDGLADFAGNSGATEAPLRLASFAPAPLVPEDGFESVTDAKVGGANIVKGGPVPPISGAQSVYVGRVGSPPLANVQPSPALDVRLTLRPGVTKVKFSYRVVSLAMTPSPGASVRLGSVGHAGTIAGVPAAGAPSEVLAPQTGNFFVTPVATAELALPADVSDELLFSLGAGDDSCSGATPPPGGMLVDDLRLE